MGGRFLVLSWIFLSSPFCIRAADYQIITEEWAPFSYMEEGRISGIVTEVVKAIMQLTHNDFEILLLPSMRTTLVLNSEAKTIMYSIFRTQERESQYKWVGPIIEESIYPYRLKSSSKTERSINELKNAKKITTRHAGLIPNLLLAQGFKNLDMRATESVQLYRMLVAQRSEIIIGDTDLGVKYYLRKLNINYSELERIPVEIFRSELYIAFSPDSDDSVVDSWRNALSILKKNGVLTAIIAKYE